MGWEEALGYAASVVVAISLMMRSIVRLRWLNLAGSLIFTVYGVLIEAYPVALLNLGIAAINIWFLMAMRRRRERFAVVDMAMDSPYMREFMAEHGQEIARFQPEFRDDAESRRNALVVLRDLVPAGVVIVEPATDGTGMVVLDYVTPAYRDFKVGEYLFDRRRDVFRALGFARLETAAGTPAHTRYLERIGFRPAPRGYSLDLGG